MPKATKKKEGRPTKYLAKYVAEAYKYVDRCKDIEDEFWKTRGVKSDSYERIIKVQLPTIEGFALYLNVAVSTLYLWAKSHHRFSEALDVIKMTQKERLIENGLSGDYSPVIAKLLLSSNHGLTERSETDLKGGFVNITDDETIKRVITAYQARTERADSTNPRG